MCVGVWRERSKRPGPDAVRAVQKSIEPELGSAVRRRESDSTETGDQRISGSRQGKGVEERR